MKITYKNLYKALYESGVIDLTVKELMVQGCKESEAVVAVGEAVRYMADFVGSSSYLNQTYTCTAPESYSSAFQRAYYIMAGAAAEHVRLCAQRAIYESKRALQAAEYWSETVR